MYDDFWAGYTGQVKPKEGFQQGSQPVRFYSSGGRQIVQQENEKIRQQKISGIYDKSKFTRMRGPAGEQGEIYANGKMYIIGGPGRQQVRTFPSRPYGVKYMQKKGWVLA